MATDSKTRPDRKPWQLLSVQIAIVVTLVGAAMWVYAFATAPKRDAGSNLSGSVGSASFKEGGKPAPAPPSKNGDARAPASPPERTVDSAAPATLRLGLSFLGAFTIAYLMRKFLRWSLLIVALAVAAIYLLQKNGVVTLPWDQIKGQVQSSASWVESQAGTAKQLLTGYLPSTAAAALGGVIGFLRG